MDSGKMWKEIALLCGYLVVSIPAYFILGGYLEKYVRGAGDVLGLLWVGILLAAFPSSMEFFMTNKKVTFFSSHSQVLKDDILNMPVIFS
jgi:hypothetical protein